MTDPQMDPTPPVRPILKTATKTGSRTRFLADSTSKYKSYSQSFHYTNYSSSASRRSSSASSASRSSASRTASNSSSSRSASTGGASVSCSESSMSSTTVAATPSLSTAASSRERKRSDEIFLTPGDRRVTFSQFTKIPRRPKSKKALAESRKMTSGFVFSTGGEGEKRKEVRKQQELQVMEKLYAASRKRTLGWRDLLLEHFTVLNDVRSWTQRCVARLKASPVAKLLRKALLKQQPQQLTHRARRVRRNSRVRRERVDGWSDYDEAEREYMKRLALQSQHSKESTSSSSSVLPSSRSSSSCSSGRSSQELCAAGFFQHSSETLGPVPDLTPMKQGSFSSLLRREGIPVDEDEQREKIAMVADLRGVGQSSLHLKVTPRRAKVF